MNKYYKYNKDNGKCTVIREGLRGNGGKRHVFLTPALDRSE